MEKLDLGKQDKPYYNPPAKPTLIDLGNLPFVVLAGQGDPSSEAFAAATEALFTLAYTIKSACKANGRDFAVPKLEGRWWVESDQPALEVPRAEWHYRLGIRMPEFVTADVFEQALPKAVAKKKALARIREIHFEHVAEGKCVTMMHIGPYATEPETMRQMSAYMAQEGLVRRQTYHIEVYISDPRTTVPDKVKTVLRFPAKKA